MQKTMSLGLIMAVSTPFALSTPTALANEPERGYGLYQTVVDGVTVTRGRALKPERSFPSDAKKTPTKAMRLSRNYRGTVFGKHRIVRDGQTVYRSQLLPVRQRGDE